MIVSTFEEDLLGLERFAKRLDKFIDTELNFVDGSLVIALSAKFGFGKTTFLEMWSSSLKKAEEEENKPKPLVISLNAWESDYCGDPLFAIIFALVECIKEEKGKEEDATKELIDAVKKFGLFTTVLAGQMIKKRSGIDIGEAGNIVEKNRANQDNKSQIQTDTFSVYEGRKKAMDSIKREIQNFVDRNKPKKILFFVDELDRCRPDYAISYLETIKHIFDVKRAVFILAADRQQLENSAKKAFGADLDFEEYYRKFIHREVSLPEISDESYAKLASKYVDYYLQREGSRISIMKLDENRVSQISKLVGTLKLTPRQIQELFRILGHICETTEDMQGRLIWKLAASSTLMAVLKIVESKLFDGLGNQTLEPEEGFELLKGTSGNLN